MLASDSHRQYQPWVMIRGHRRGAFPLAIIPFLSPPHPSLFCIVPPCFLETQFSPLEEFLNTAQMTVCCFVLQSFAWPLPGVWYCGTCLRLSLCRAATSLKQPASLSPNSTKALQSTSVMQQPLYKGQLELAHMQVAVLDRCAIIRTLPCLSAS